jgi:hypothetical protein
MPEASVHAKPKAGASPDQAGAVEVHLGRETHGTADLTALRRQAEIFADYQVTRLAISNRVSDATDRELLEAQVAAIRKVEEMMGGILVAEYHRAVPASIREWQENAIGLGAQTFARLLGHLGHPRQARPYRWVTGRAPVGHKCGSTCGKGRHLVGLQPYERTVGQLWSYCGVGDPRRKRRSGMPVDEALACGSPRLHSLVFVVASDCVRMNGVPDKNGRTRARSPYRDLYDAVKLKYADKLHNEPCHRCGPSGRPAPAGSPWSLSHQHHNALRLVGKRILKDLWLAAEDGVQPGSELQSRGDPSPAASVDGRESHETHRRCAVPPAAGERGHAATETHRKRAPSPLPGVDGHGCDETQDSLAVPPGNGGKGQ